MDIINFHFQQAANVGDRASAPGLYLPDLAASITLADVCDRVLHHPQFVIMGGGALLPKIIKRQLVFSVPAVIWGAGWTSTVRRRPDYWLPAGYSLVGVRDYGLRYRWVPCASCLSPLFDQHYPITREFVVYENVLSAPLPAADLGNDYLDMAAVIRTLGSAETVITSSYHGAYWATLLGRRVVAIPFGAKFYGMRHPPRLSTWEERQQPGPYYPEALAECRAANLAFAADVREIIET